MSRDIWDVVGYDGKLDTPKKKFVPTKGGSHSALQQFKMLARSKTGLGLACAQLGTGHTIVWSSVQQESQHCSIVVDLSVKQLMNP
jgi:hypothetical protein